MKRREDILDGFEEHTATGLLKEYTELHKSYVVRYFYWSSVLWGEPELSI